MKKDNIYFYLLLFGIIVTIISELVAFPLVIKYATILVLLILGSYFAFSIFTGEMNEENVKMKIIRMVSAGLFALTCAILALFQSVRTSDMVFAIEIVSVLNAIFAIYATIGKVGERISIKHYIVFTFLIGVSAFA